MLPQIRRDKQLLDSKDCEAILLGTTHGVLAVQGDDGYPYAVPLSYVYADGRIYIHCAKVGHKLRGIGRCEKVSFCVVGQDVIVPETFSTDYRSVIVFGHARLLEKSEDIRRALEAIAARYAPGESNEHVQREIGAEMSAVRIIEITPERISGKESKRLAQQREENERMEGRA